MINEKTITLLVKGDGGGFFERIVTVNYDDNESDSVIEKRAKLSFLNDRIYQTFGKFTKIFDEVGAAEKKAGVRVRVK